MAFWSKWFAPKCDECNEPMVDERMSFDEREVCGDCHPKLVAVRAKKEAELEAQRAAEDEARRKLEDRAAWGGDERLKR